MSDAEIGQAAGVQRTFPLRYGVAVAVGALLLAGAATLWARYGGAVFLDTLMAGLAACF